MTCDLHAVTFAAGDPSTLGRFWGRLLGRTMADDGDSTVVLPDEATDFRLRFSPCNDVKVLQNRMHFDLTSTSLDDQRQIVARALDLGARHIDIGQSPDEEHVVLADPEGNEFCVIEPGNQFLAGCGSIGALSCDGTRAVGHFWSEALGWPLVWDQDQETAIQSPEGGPKISWGGPPLMPRAESERLRLDVAPPPGGDQQVEVDRLLALGARRVDVRPTRAGPVVLADPDGNEFFVLPPGGTSTG